LAELGFIVLCLDGTGTPYRGRDLHDRQYRNMGAATLDDHAAVIRQLGERYAEIDTERVGIYGISAGGYSSTRAMLTHPETYKVAVSLSGSHDPRLHGFGWIERYMGLMSWPELGEQANARLAANLQGKLLLVTGDMDDSDPTLMTFRMVDALVKANKDFDLLVLPNANHSLLDLSLGAGATHADSPSFRYFTRKRWDYFVRHLLGAEPPAGYEVSAPVAD
jgi:dipeptidyl aminopeptidase/acylaminoacyl peptidase